MIINFLEKISTIESILLNFIKQPTELDEIAQIESFKQKLKDTNTEFKSFVVENGFSCLKDEICFFKEIKPKLWGWFDTLTFVRETEMTLNALSYESRALEVRKLIKKNDANIRKALKNNVLGITHNEYDSINFTQLSKQGKRTDTLVDDYYYCKKCDDLKTYYANLYKKEYLQSKINQINFFKDSTLSRVKWEGSKSDFAELVYAIAESGAIDMSKSSVTELSLKLQQVIDVGPEVNVNRIMNDVKKRTKDFTRFLDKITDNLRDYILR